jgi:hypothetical protein
MIKEESDISPTKLGLTVTVEISLISSKYCLVGFIQSLGMCMCEFRFEHCLQMCVYLNGDMIQALHLKTK